MVAFAGYIRTPVTLGIYPDQNPTWPPVNPAIHLGDREGVHMVVDLLGAFAKHQPIDILGRSYGGWIWRSFFEDFYERVWLIPSTVDFGPITGTTGKQVFLWNAHLHAVDLDSIIPPTDSSLSIVGLSAPATFKALAGTTFFVYADEDGQPSINDQISFTFDPLENIVLPVIGTRSRLWPWPPNWGEGVEVTLELRTEIITSEGGKEQRIAVRQSPRKNITFESHVHKSDFRTFHRQMTIWAGRSTIVPEYSRYATLSADAVAGQGYIDVVSVPAWVMAGSLMVLVNKESNDLKTVEAISGNRIAFSSNLNNNWPAGSKANKALAGRLATDVSTSQETNQLAVAELDFEAAPGVEVWPDPGTASIVHNSREVFLKRPNWKDSLDESYTHFLKQVDYGVGVIDNFLDITYVPKTHKANYVGRNPEEATEVENFFRRMNGRQGEFYMPTFTEDIVAKEDMPIDTVSIRVDGPYFSRDYNLDTIYKDLIIFLSDGSYIMRRVQSIYEVDDALGNDSVVQVDDGFDREILLSDIRQICWMPLWRMASDAMTFVFLTDTVCEFAMTMQTLEYEDAE